MHEWRQLAVHHTMVRRRCEQGLTPEANHSLLPKLPAFNVWIANCVNAVPRTKPQSLIVMSPAL
jgi:hypothetical protein